MEVKRKRILITNARAIKLARERAEKENRSAANAAATTIIEHLGKADDTDQKGQE